MAKMKGVGLLGGSYVEATPKRLVKERANIPNMPQPAVTRLVKDTEDKADSTRKGAFFCRDINNQRKVYQL